MLRKKTKTSLLLFLLACSFNSLLAMMSSTDGKVSINHFVNEDGSLSIPEGFSGSVDLSGFSVTLDECEGIVATPLPMVFGWSSVGSGLNNTCIALAVDGSGNVYAGGSFTEAGGQPANRIARWDGNSWSSLGGGLNNPCLVLAIDGNGNIYAGGSFTEAGGQPANRIARWDGSSWSSLGSGVDNNCEAIAVDGNGNVYAGGFFIFAGGQEVNRIARWDGSSWSSLGSGLNNPCRALFIDGNDNVYAAGGFTQADGQSANRIARWDGSSWSSLGSGLNDWCYALAIDGNGNVYVGGEFTVAGGQSANRIARWDGSSWSSLGSGLNGNCWALAIDGSGDIYAGGSFTVAGGQSANRIARWDGSSWSSLGSGLNNIFCYGVAVDGNGNVYTGGDFTEAGGQPANYIAKWGEIPCDLGITSVDVTNETCPGQGGTITINATCTTCISSILYSIDGGLTTQTSPTFTGVATGITHQPYVGDSGDGNCTAIAADVTISMGVDMQFPTANCPSTQTVSNDAGQCGANISFTIPDPIDDCPGVTSMASPASDSFFGIGMTTVVITATDASGNTGTCSFNVTVNDTEAPTANCPPTQTVSNDAGQCGATVNFSIPSATDNCPGVSTSVDPVSGSFFDVGTTPVTVTATDASGNTSTCSFNVVVNDTEDPTANCSSTQTVSNDPGQCGANINFSVPAQEDNCSFTTAFYAPTLGSFFEVGTSTVTVTATDGSGNTASCSFDLVVNDTEAPTANCPPTQTVSNEAGQCGANVSFTIPDPVDNCTGATSSAATDSGSFFDVGSTPVNVTATDASGNTSTCSFNVVVNDTEAPTVSCPSPQTGSNDAGQCGANVSFSIPDPTDNCPVATSMADPASGSFFDVGTTPVTVTATDASGNTSTCSFNVLVNDIEAPTANCPSTQTMSNDLGQCGANVNFSIPNPTDNCPGATSTADPASGSFFDVGTTPVTVTATDASGNTSSCSFDVVVNDTEAPVPVCVNQTITFNGEDEITIPVTDLYDAINSLDNCGTVNLETGDQVIACENVDAVVTITLTVNDGNGNTATCLANVTVEGLPCSWMDNGGIDCTGGTAGFNSGNFTMLAGDCAPEFPYTSDATSFISTELCGDGEIIARVDNVNGGQGFAGVMIRDSEAPSSTKVSIGTNTINRVRKEVRAIPGYPSFPQAVLAYNQFWVRITRTGPTFRAYASPDGAQWFPYIFQNIQMGSCVRAGLFVYNDKATSPIMATFSNVNVSVNGVPVGAVAGAPGVNLGGLDHATTQGENLRGLSQGIVVYPNPTSGELNIDLGSFLGERADISVFNSMGQQVLTRRVDEVQTAIEQLDMSQLQAGMYHVSVKVGEAILTERVVIAR